ncbi:hypothetical protein [Streptomyces sp. BP-8]|uniref:Uncharacterized protein n=1 Tax=Streptomyces sirii TaxID=3127701 RepID=A0ABZ2QMJ2_9ACTN
MTDVRISSAVMTHPRRLPRARELAALLGLDAVVVDPDPDGPPSALRTALAAWAAAAPGATHHLVLQDDVAAPAFLRDLVRRSVRRHPADALAFYAAWNTRNGSAVRLAALVGAGWVRGVPEEFTPTQAVCLPAAMAEDFRRYARGSTDRHDDEVLSAYLRLTGRMSLIAVPNPVEHIDTDSIAGFDWHGLRRSACPLQEPGIAVALETGWVLEHPGGLPYMRQGEGHARVEGPDGVIGTRGHARWLTALPYLGCSEEQVHRLVHERRPADVAAAVGRAFGHRFADELWIHGLLLGRQAARLTRCSPVQRLRRPMADRLDRRVRAAAVATLGVSSLLPEARQSVRPDQAALLETYVRSGLRCGRAWPDEASPTAPRLGGEAHDA